MFLVFVTVGVCRARVLFTIYIGVFVSASVEFWKKTSKTAHAVPWRCKVSALYLDSSSTINPRNNTYLSCLACDHACACNRGAYLRLISSETTCFPYLLLVQFVRMLGKKVIHLTKTFLAVSLLYFLQEIK